MYEVRECKRSEALIYGIYCSKNLTCFCGRVVSKIHSSTLILTCLWMSKRVLMKSLDTHTPPAQCMPGYTHPLPSACWDTPPCPVHGGIHTPLRRHPLADTPLADTPPTGRHPRRPLQRTVRILLECILVLLMFVICSLIFFAFASTFVQSWSYLLSMKSSTFSIVSGSAVPNSGVKPKYSSYSLSDSLMSSKLSWKIDCKCGSQFHTSSLHSPIT